MKRLEKKCYQRRDWIRIVLAGIPNCSDTGSGRNYEAEKGRGRGGRKREEEVERDKKGNEGGCELVKRRDSRENCERKTETHS